MLRIACAFSTLILTLSVCTAQEDGNRFTADARTDGEDQVKPLDVRSGSGSSVTKTTQGIKQLPNQEGQMWVEYDITPYTGQLKNVEHPERAVVDWILRETGTAVWFGEPLGMLSAGKGRLRVYHTRAVHDAVLRTVDRFNGGEKEPIAFGMRLVSVSGPNWRTRAHRMLQPVEVQTQGVQAWLLSKEEAVVLLADLRKRADFREHNAPNIVVHNGQNYTVNRRRPRNYVKAIRPRQNIASGYDMEMGKLSEGFTLHFSPLLSQDESTIDAVIRCDVDQIEKLSSVWIDVPTAASPRQRVQMQVPQMASWRLHERFRWPAEKVLLLSCGVGAPPEPGKNMPFGIPVPISTGPARTDALLFLEYKGKASKLLTGDASTLGVGKYRYGGRY